MPTILITDADSGESQPIPLDADDLKALVYLHADEPTYVTVSAALGMLRDFARASFDYAGAPRKTGGIVAALVFWLMRLHMSEDDFRAAMRALSGPDVALGITITGAGDETALDWELVTLARPSDAMLH